MHSFDAKKYLYVLAITSFIFFTAIFFSNYFNDRRLSELRSIADTISVDILSSETQYALFQESSCTDVGTPTLAPQLNELAEKLSYAEGQLGDKNEEVRELKRYYSLLEIKDYLLNKRIAEKCGQAPSYVIYFYSNEGDCPDCEREGYVLTYLREKYPSLKVYSFDYHLDLAALRTLISILKIKNELPSVVIGGQVSYGFKEKEALEAFLPKKLRDEAERAAATSSPDN